MKNRTFSWLKKLAAGASMAFMFAMPATQVLAAEPAADIYYSYVTPTSFNPSNNETVKIYWYVNTQVSSIEVEIYDGPKSQGGNKVSDLIGTSPAPNVPNPVVWTGKVNNVVVPNGTYYYYVTAFNSSNLNNPDEWEGSFQVTGGGGGNNNPDAPVIGTSNGNDNNDFASPNPFDPNTQTTTIYYTLSSEADVYITMKDPNTNQAVETLYQHQTAGARNQVWDGRNGSNQPFPEKVYTYEIFASNISGSNTETGTVEIKYVDGGSGTDPVIGTSNGNDSSDFASPNPFDPNTQTTTIYYTLNTSVDSVTVQVLDGSQTIETITGGKNSGLNTAVWDGRNSANQPFPEKVYTYRITATKGGNSNTEDGTVEIKYAGTSGGNAPEILELYTEPSVFDPSDGEKTNVFFRLDEAANVTVEILDGNTIVREVVDDAAANSGLSFVEWNGRNQNNSIVNDDVYAVRVTACDKVDTSACDVAFTTVEVDSDGSGSGSSVQITNDFASPNPFDPDEENTRIYYTLNKSADVTVKIFDEDNDLVRTLLDDVSRNSGANNVSWNGEDRFGDQVSDGDYTYRITACATGSSTDCDTESGKVEVDSDGSSDDLISNVEVNNAVFDPTDNEEAEICFDIEVDDVKISIDVLDGNSVIRKLVHNQIFDRSNNRCFEWDGEDDDGDIVDDDVYQFRIRAEKGNDVEVQFAYTEVDTDGIIIGFPGSTKSCGGFTDIPASSPLCKILELLGFRGIFAGYPDGTFRPFADINRAEAVKSILLALDYDILSDDGSNLGYWDVQPRAWYMAYLRTAQREGVATGYPDRSFRPGGTINRVELLRVFLEASNINVPFCNVQPYADTPINSETRWYIDYACFAKAYGLMSTDGAGNFNPAQPMSRGDVAMLFYNFEMRGLFAGYNPNFYSSYYNNFNSSYYMSPGYGFYPYGTTVYAPYY